MRARAPRATTPDVLRPVFIADWLRMTTFQPGLGPVLWSESPQETMARLEREWDRPGVGRVKMTPAGANALRAMDEPPPALLAFYAGREPIPADAEIPEDPAIPVEAAPEPSALAAAVAEEVEAVESLALVPAGLSTAGRGRTG